MRVARATTCLEVVASMYEKGLGLKRLGGFRDHEGFDGEMLGHPGAPYHLEFTQREGETELPRPHPEAMLVFYVPGPDLWANRCDAMLGAGFTEVRSENPYWQRAGRTFEDPDGGRVVIQRGTWPGDDGIR